MIRPARLVTTVTAALVSCSASAVDSTMTQGGFTGLGITPNAHLLGWGRFDFAYDRQLPGVTVNPDGNNYVAGFGLLPNVEVSGRVAASPNPDNCLVASCGGVRDLSASAKVGIGLDTANHFFAALGAADVGGAATNFRAYYGVLTYDADPFQFSAGLARRPTPRANRPRSPLHGPFASAAWQPLPWLRGHLEYSDRNAWAGVRLFAPGRWLPEGWSAYIGANARINNNDLTRRSWITAGVSIPLYKVPDLPARGGRAPLPELAGSQQPLPAYEARALPPPAPGAAAPAPAPVAAISDEQLLQLAARLRERGLEDIWIGRMPDASLAIRANNASYNWNSTDALGAALGALGSELGATPVGYRLVLTQRQLPLVAVTGQTDCLQAWIQGRETRCPAGELSTPGTMPLDELQAGATWVVRNLQPSWRTLRVALSPVLRTNVATEAGVLDYSLGVNAGLSQPLWPGAIAEWRVQHEIARSNDYAPNGILGGRRVLNGTERLAFTQVMRLPLERWFGHGDELAARRWGLAAVTGQVTIGRIASHFDGAYGALRWEPGEGRHRFTAQGGYFTNRDYGLVPGEPRSARPLLGTYRYSIAPTRTYVEFTGGQFMNNDRGAQLGLRQWFGDVAVQAYIRRTSIAGNARSQAGLEISLPLGPRRDMDPRGIQLTGTPRFSHAIETTVGSGANVVTSGRGLLPPVPTLDALHNSDRAGLVYFEDNARRIRDAAR